MGSRYVDLFATKGIEYILVISFLVLFVLFWRALVSGEARLRVARVPAAIASAASTWFRPVAGLFYHPGHAWARPTPGGLVRVGMDEMAARLLGRPDRLVLPRPGARVKQGEVAWTVEVDRTPFEVLSPVEGEVVAVNEEAMEAPRIVADDPYSRGWLLLVRVPHLRANLKNLLGGRPAQAWLAGAEDALRERMLASAGPVLQDGGVPLDGFARQLDPEGWVALARDVLGGGAPPEEDAAGSG